MFAIDFSYDNICLSEYGFIVCDFNYSNGANNVNTGANISFNTVSRKHGHIHSVTSAYYEECLSAEFDICKNPDIYDDLEISTEEFRQLARWLNRRQFLKFEPIDDEHDALPCYFDASFNVEKILISERLYGIHLNMQTNRPFGYGDVRKYEWKDVTPGISYLVGDISDDIGEKTYLSMGLKCNSSGTMIITNTDNNLSTEIKNVTSGEIITIDGDTLQIVSSTSHNVCDDFNYEFPAITNSFHRTTNHFIFSLSCDVDISYIPIIKDSL